MDVQCNFLKNRMLFTRTAYTFTDKPQSVTCVRRTGWTLSRCQTSTAVSMTRFYTQTYPITAASPTVCRHLDTTFSAVRHPRPFPAMLEQWHIPTTCGAGSQAYRARASVRIYIITAAMARLFTTVT